MVMRVTHHSRFNIYTENMRTSLSRLTQTYEKQVTQKKVNRPSDSPVNAARILNHRDRLDGIDQFQANAKTGLGWLNLADEMLLKVEDTITRLREIATQAATGTMSPTNREQVSYEARQLYEQLIADTNVDFEGKSLFSGHHTESPAFDHALWLTASDDSLANASNASFTVEGNLDRSAVFCFTESGIIGGAESLDYAYSLDGGNTFIVDVLPPGETVIQIGGAQVSFISNAGALATVPGGGGMTPVSGAGRGLLEVSAADLTAYGTADNGTWMWVRPTARYLGDDNDTLFIDSLGSSNITPASGVGPFITSAEGNFQPSVTVRLDTPEDVIIEAGDIIEYSYSTDGGLTWVTGQETTARDSLGTASNVGAVLVVPGGLFTINEISTASGAAGLLTGEQFNIRRNTADIMAHIGPNEQVKINNVGKDIFGGIYEDPATGITGLAHGAQAPTPGQNLFEAIGKLIGYLETNTQAGIQESVAELQDALGHILNHNARIGAVERRLDVSITFMDTLRENQIKQLSAIEDANFNELSVLYESQKIIYETVLRSSSQIMRLSLANFM